MGMEVPSLGARRSAKVSGCFVAWSSQQAAEKSTMGISPQIWTGLVMLSLDCLVLKSSQKLARFRQRMFVVCHVTFACLLYKSSLSMFVPQASVGFQKVPLVLYGNRWRWVKTYYFHIIPLWFPYSSPIIYSHIIIIPILFPYHSHIIAIVLPYY